MDHEEVKQIPTSLENPNFPARARQVGWHLLTSAATATSPQRPKHVALHTSLPASTTTTPTCPHTCTRSVRTWTQARSKGHWKISTAYAHACALRKPPSTAPLVRGTSQEGKRTRWVSSVLTGWRCRAGSMDGVHAQSKLGIGGRESGWSSTRRCSSKPGGSWMFWRCPQGRCEILPYFGPRWCSFWELGPHIHGAATRRDRQGAERDEVGAALHLHALSKTKKNISVEEKTAKDQFFLAAQTAPRKFAARFQKGLYISDSTKSKDVTKTTFCFPQMQGRLLRRKEIVFWLHLQVPRWHWKKTWSPSVPGAVNDVTSYSFLSCTRAKRRSKRSTKQLIGVLSELPHHKYQKYEKKKTSRSQDQTHVVWKNDFFTGLRFYDNMFLFFCLWRVSPIVIWSAAWRRRGEIG